ncbi:MAG: hypothetical protein AABZ57_06570 [Candidatus Margulisiibacteriota bacterium]
MVFKYRGAQIFDVDKFPDDLKYSFYWSPGKNPAREITWAMLGISESTRNPDEAAAFGLTRQETVFRNANIFGVSI